MWALARESGVLEVNTVYSYVMLCRYFAETCAVAAYDGELVGFVTALPPPSQPQTLFVWQIAVAEAYRGQGIAVRLLEALLERPACREVRFVEASVAASNAASRALFGRFAAELGVGCETVPGFVADWFPNAHEAEPLLRIGPLASRLHTSDLSVADARA